MTRQLAPCRLPDWQDRLTLFIELRRSMAFAWGSNDCALFAADAVVAMTGVDFGAPFRGRYDDAAGAALALRDYGGGTLLRTFDRHLDRRAIAFAQRGDLAMARGAIGVIMGDHALFVSDCGIERIDRAEWQRCWAV
jgi:hypothetical protein